MREMPLMEDGAVIRNDDETLPTDPSTDQAFETPVASEEELKAEKGEGAEGIGDKNEAVKSQEKFEEKKAQSEQEAKQKAEEVREELRHGGEEVNTVKEEAAAKIGDLITETQNKKIEVISRMEEEVHFKKAFPFLSIFDFFGLGRTSAKAFYPEEYRAKVDVKEMQDENTLSRLNDREARLQELISEAGVQTDLEKLEAILGQLKSLSEADEVDKKTLEESNPENEEAVVKDQPKSREGDQKKKPQ